MIRDFFDIILSGLMLFTAKELVVTLVVALLLSGGFWLLFIYFVRLWNKKFHFRGVYKIVCLFSVCLAFVFVVMYAGIGKMHLVIEDTVTAWEDRLLHDEKWQGDVYYEAFYTVKESGLENFSRAVEPPSEHSMIPATKEDTYLLIASIYADNACDNFRYAYPFLSRIIHIKEGIPAGILYDDLRSFFKGSRGGDRVYKLFRSVELASDEIKQQLIVQAPKVVRITRICICILFLVVQLVPFSLIAWLAYRDL